MNPRQIPATTQGFHGVAGLAAVLIDEIDCGLVVCDEHSVIRFANQAAQRELLSARALALTGERLRRVGEAGDDLDAAIQRAAQRGRRSLVRLGQGGDRLMVSVQPLCLDNGAEPAVLIVLGRRQPCSELGLELLANSFGLTLTERRVMAALLRQASPREIAADHAVALSTVRTQISAIRAKTGSRNIDSLLLRAAEMPPVASALRMAHAASSASLRAAA
jgi:DNA-binding CsgD family transcriptional regulator